MMKNEVFLDSNPAPQDLKKELARVRKKPSAGAVVRGVITAVIVVAALISVLVTCFFPISKVSGEEMSPAIEKGSVLISVKTRDVEPGDICCFYSGTTVLFRRIIAVGGEVIDIDENGRVFVDGVLTEEPYAAEARPAESDIVFPYMVPENTYFVMSDNRALSTDSRDSKIGCVSESQVIGKPVFCLWPVSGFGKAAG